MSRLSEQITMSGPADAAKTTCRNAVNGLGWKVSDEGDSLVAKPGMSATAWPSKLTLGFSEAGGSTTVNVDGHIYGWGPIQKKHLRKHMDKFRDAVSGGSGAG